MLDQNGSSKADTLVKLVLIFFISLLSFSVGTFVGKQFSDSQYKMAALENSENGGAVDRDTASVDPKAMDVEPNDALTEEDVATLEEEFVNKKPGEAAPAGKDKIAMTNDKSGRNVAAENEDSKPGEAASSRIYKKPGAKEEISKSLDTTKGAAKKNDKIVENAAKKVVNGDTASFDTKSEGKRIPNAIPLKLASDVIGKYTVQVSAYNNEADAIEHSKSLKEKGFSAFYVQAKNKGKTWYRVSIGVYTTAKEAEDNVKKVVGQADIKSAIVQKIVQQ